MTNLTDQQLLQDYAGRRSEPAFAELVRRHVDLVHSAAVRMVRDPHLAQDVTQAVFVALAQNARQLADRPVLSGWLHRTAKNLAANAVRTTVRRRAREQEAAAMNELLAHHSETAWEHIAPHLDAALGELTEPDRDALLLRYFERKSAREMALTLGVSEDAAQKRVTRAVERLREFFAKRGITIGAGGLVVLISTNAVQAAPAGLAVAITAAAFAGTAVTTATVAATKAIAMTTLQKTFVAAVIIAASSVGIYEANQASTLRTQVETLQQQQTPMAGQIAQLQQERDNALARQRTLQQQNEQLRESVAELPRLRGELTQLKSPPPPQSAPVVFSSTLSPLDLYADLSHRTVLHGTLPPLPDSLTARMLAERDRAAEILSEELSKQGFRLVLDGEKFAQILPASERTARTSPLFHDTDDDQTANQMIDFSSIDLPTFLDVLGGVFRRTVLRPSNLPAMTVSLRFKSQLTRDEARHAIWVVLSLNGFTVVPDGDKFVQVVSTSDTARVHANAPQPDPGAPLIQPAEVPMLKPPSSGPKVRLPGTMTPPPPSPKATLDDLMRFYAKQLDKTFVSSSRFSDRHLVFEVQTPLTQAELVYAIKTMLALNDLAIEPVGDNSIRLSSTAQRRSGRN